MRKLIKSLFGKKTEEPTEDLAFSKQNETAPTEIVVDGMPSFQITSHISWCNNFPILDWDEVHSWVEKAPSDELKAIAWNACEHGWLVHFQQALGKSYTLVESEGAVVLSSLGTKRSRATIDYMNRTLSRVTKVLDGIARLPQWGKDILIVFHDADSYYSYVSHYYPDNGGEFAFSGGMHINSGCSHYVTVDADMHSVESIIAHEMTHGCLSHLPLPLWLNEGLAVNTERRLAGSGVPLYTPAEMRAKHLCFWGENEIQEFWSGKSFNRPDDGNLLSYDLARIMIELMAKDWERFRQFVLNADMVDGGAGAAQEYLGVDLGNAVCSLLEKPLDDTWTPAPKRWSQNQT